MGALLAFLFASLLHRSQTRRRVRGIVNSLLDTVSKDIKEIKDDIIPGIDTSLLDITRLLEALNLASPAKKFIEEQLGPDHNMELRAILDMKAEDGFELKADIFSSGEMDSLYKQVGTYSLNIASHIPWTLLLLPDISIILPETYRNLTALEDSSVAISEQNRLYLDAAVDSLKLVTIYWVNARTIAELAELDQQRDGMFSVSLRMKISALEGLKTLHIQRREHMQKLEKQLTHELKRLRW